MAIIKFKFMVINQCAAIQRWP